MVNAEKEGVKRGSSGARWVLLGLLGVSTLVAVLVAWRFRVSEQYIIASLEEMEARGAELTPEGCVDAMLSWRKECEAMKSLCDSTVDRMIQACLGGQDRVTYCEALDGAAADAHYGYERCQERGLSKRDRQLWKPCGDAYKTMDQYCRHVMSEARETK